MMELRNIRRTSLVLIFLIAILMLCSSCSMPVDEQEYEEYDNTIFPSELIGSIKDKKIYLTSVGQSTDMLDFKEMVLDNIEDINYVCDPFLEVTDVDNDSVVLIFVGCSIKALAESEATIDGEVERSKGFVTSINRKNLQIICFHMGGQSRRGASSDLLIDNLFPYSNFNVYLDKSNSDGYLYEVSYQNNVKSYQVINTLSLEKVMNLLLGKDGE